jgi:hypothetical protein
MPDGGPMPGGGPIPGGGPMPGGGFIVLLCSGSYVTLPRVSRL